MTKLLNSPFKGNLDLKRYPLPKAGRGSRSSPDPLQAWDSADELLLQHLHQFSLERKKILIVNDSFGALSCALEGLDTIPYTDSYLSLKATQMNSENRINPLTRLQEITGFFDFALIRIPKNMSFFEDILCHVSNHLHSGSKLLCGYMIKHQANAAFNLLNQYIGETTTSLAQKKARIIFADFQRKPALSPYPLQAAFNGLQVPLEIPFVNHSNLFSREKLDIGTRFLLAHIPKGNFKKILDLGCANGLIGIAAKKANPAATVIFSDESQMAIQSAMTNYQNYFTDSAEFSWTNCYENQEPNSVDLVICNPPFHQGNALDKFIALQMFKNSRHCLVPNGILRVIGNSHLQYPGVLKKLFGNSKVVARNDKFTIVDAVKKP